MNLKHSVANGLKIKVRTFLGLRISYVCISYWEKTDRRGLFAPTHPIFRPFFIFKESFVKRNRRSSACWLGQILIDLPLHMYFTILPFAITYTFSHQQIRLSLCILFEFSSLKPHTTNVDVYLILPSL